MSSTSFQTHFDVTLNGTSSHIPGHDLTRFCWALRAPAPTVHLYLTHTQGPGVALLVSSSVRHTHTLTHAGLDSNSVSSLSYLATLKAGSECWTPRRATGCWVKAPKSPQGLIYCPGRERATSTPHPRVHCQQERCKTGIKVTRRPTGVRRLGHRSWRPYNLMARKQEDLAGW